MKHNKVALGLIFCLFFLWAISSNLLPTMIRQLMKTCELNTFEASFTESAYWLAYFICPIPIAMFMRRYSYRVGIITGLLAQGYPVREAALLGVWLHATAGDLAAREMGQECMLASDITRHLPEAFRELHNQKNQINDKI